MCSANYSARAFGICASMSVREARARCPQLEVISTSPGLFEQLTETSKRVNRILLQVTERIEPLSCDEMQLQLGCDSGEPQYEPVLLARVVRAAVLRVNGYPAGIGVGHSRVVDRLATRRAKPPGDGVHFTPPERVLEALRLSTSAVAEHLRNDFGCPDRCHGSRLQSI